MSYLNKQKDFPQSFSEFSFKIFAKKRILKGTESETNRSLSVFDAAKLLII